MKWSDNNMIWGRPLRSILAVYNKKLLSFSYGHLKSTDSVIIEKDLTIKNKKVKNFNEYNNLLRNNKIIINQEERKKIIVKKFEVLCKSRNFKEDFNTKLLEEVVNIVENPNAIIIEFNKEYLKLPQEIIISTLQSHQRYPVIILFLH